MGALFNQYCYDSQQQAIDAFFSARGPEFQSSGTSLATRVVLYHNKNGSTWQQCTKNMDNVNPICINAPIPNLPDCDPSTGFNDGVLIGWGIVAAMAMAYAFRLMAKATT